MKSIINGSRLNSRTIIIIIFIAILAAALPNPAAAYTPPVGYITLTCGEWSVTTPAYNNEQMLLWRGCTIQTALSPLYYLYGRQMFDGKLIEYTVREVTQ